MTQYSPNLKAMAPERWQQVSRLFKVALEHEPAQRRAVLAGQCKGDSSLCGEVEALLASYEAAENSWLKPPVPLPELLREGTDETSLAGQRLGQYQITHEIGCGGMGAVYAAHRADDEYKKRVAIKVVKRGMDTREVLKRFRYERQILASLDHPNIARLLDGGTTSDGLPYFVLEYVEGEPLTRYGETHNLSLTERLELFREVCAAVSYAHQNLVVHRDLKPDNILVTPDGTPKLLDFGIAKLLRPDFFPDTVIPTGLAVRPMTPDYASPEQVRGLPITTASDVYSLGVVLYELLTGHKPYSLNNYTPQEIERVICEEEPKRPSLTVSRRQTAPGPEDKSAGERQTQQKPQITQRSLWGDVDNILLMALRKEPNRRYASAEQFSEDVRRYLNGLPVAAHKDTLLYRSRKFVTRHKIGVLAITALTVTILSFAVFARLQATRIAHERDKSEKVAAFLMNMFQSVDPKTAQGKTVTARELLDNGAQRAETQFHNQPELQAQLFDTLGQVYHSLGLYQNAIQMLDKALGLRQQTLDANAPETAETLVHLAAAWQGRNEYQKSDELLQQALALQRRAFGNKDDHIAQTLNERHSILILLRDYDTAENCAREALEIRRRLYGNEHPKVAHSLGKVARALSQKGDFVAAAALYRESLEMTRRLLGSTSPEMVAKLSNLGEFYTTTGDFTAAEPLRREECALTRQLYGPQSQEVASGLYNLAALLQYQTKFAEAEPLYRESLAIRRHIYGAEHIETYYGLIGLGILLYNKGDFPEAESLLRESLAMNSKLFGEQNVEVTRSLNVLGRLLYDEGKLAETESVFRQAIQVGRVKLTPKDSKLGHSLIGLGMALTDQGRPEQAEPLLREGLEILYESESKNAWWSAWTADGQSALGACLAAQGRYDEAAPLLQESYPVIQNGLGAQHQRTIRARQRLAHLKQEFRLRASRKSPLRP